VSVSCKTGIKGRWESLARSAFSRPAYLDSHSSLRHDIRRYVVDSKVASPSPNTPIAGLPLLVFESAGRGLFQRF
jgi:hypothetical protein